MVWSKKPATSSKKFIKKVMKEVGWIHEVRPIKGCGLVICTPFFLERKKVSSNAKIEEMVLNVNRKLVLRVVIQRAHTEISHEEFMKELLRLNLKDLSFN